MKLKLILLAAIQTLALLSAHAQSLDSKIDTILNRPEFRHALFFANNVPVGADLKAVFKVGDALAEIATTPYD